MRFHTTFSLHIKAHKLHWYREWHQWRLSHHFHTAMLGIYILSIIVGSLAAFFPENSAYAATQDWTFGESPPSSYYSYGAEVLVDDDGSDEAELGHHTPSTDWIADSGGAHFYYRKTLTILNSGSELTNYQVPITTGFGIIAVIVSCIGMFNTLTISLIEKTREIGIMKSLGTTRKDIRKIFISEALLIGIVGGLSGIILSYLIGQMLNASIYALAKTSGNTAVKIFVFPLELILIALVMSIMISVLTGAYPSRRASRISALNALRYE